MRVKEFDESLYWDEFEECYRTWKRELNSLRVLEVKHGMVEAEIWVGADGFSTTGIPERYFDAWWEAFDFNEKIIEEKTHVKVLSVDWDIPNDTIGLTVKVMGKPSDVLEAFYLVCTLMELKWLEAWQVYPKWKSLVRKQWYKDTPEEWLKEIEKLRKLIYG